MESEEQERTASDRNDSRLLIEGEGSTQDGAVNVAMEIISTPDRPRSWKGCLIGIGSKAYDKAETTTKDEEDDFDLLDGDIVKSSINGIPTIDFSTRVNQLLIKDMEHTVVIKLLGRNIGCTTLQNKILSLWQPSQPFRLMDIENGYYLEKFQNPEDFEKVLS
ncbi:hypothetical protein CXB51_034928 [Gossypium anomalum]|uniref:DUF4283 domain-containing protein n=1 Tax=Gossypium anomalum TaxID=47600 RepID=A0A8J5XQD6_9ROSI|nr:hypothetical protein CXB51_034928 [Gossypium anomalum]